MFAVCTAANVYVPLVLQNTTIEHVRAYHSSAGRNKQPVIARVNSTNLVRIVQNADLSSREVVEGGLCSIFFPNLLCKIRTD